MEAVICSWEAAGTIVVAVAYFCNRHDGREQRRLAAMALEAGCTRGGILSQCQISLYFGSYAAIRDILVDRLFELTRRASFALPRLFLSLSMDVKGQNTWLGTFLVKPYEWLNYTTGTTENSAF